MVAENIVKVNYMDGLDHIWPEIGLFFVVSCLFVIGLLYVFKKEKGVRVERKALILLVATSLVWIAIAWYALVQI